MVLLPKEHGAYAQLAVPLVTGISVTGPTVAGVCLIVAAAAAFAAHEPAVILLGRRGPRATRQHGRAAVRWLAAQVMLSVVSAAIAVGTMDAAARWSIAIPGVFALLVAATVLCDREKSWYGETAAAIAFAGLALPQTMAGGAPLASAAAVALPFALLFVTTSLAVRAVIVRVRGGGDARAAAALRWSAFGVSVAGAAGLAWLTALELLPATTLFAASPGVAAVVTFHLWPLPAARLRAIGWTLACVSAATAVITVATV
jgi:hypothetical protein